MHCLDLRSQEVFTTQAFDPLPPLKRVVPLVGARTLQHSTMDVLHGPEAHSSHKSAQRTLKVGPGNEGLKSVVRKSMECT